VTLGLSDSQLRFVTAICQPLPVEKRGLFLERLVAYLRMHDCLRHPDQPLFCAAMLIKNWTCLCHASQMEH
jgi:hypothetical protein